MITISRGAKQLPLILLGSTSLVSTSMASSTSTIANHDNTVDDNKFENKNVVVVETNYHAASSEVEGGTLRKKKNRKLNRSGKSGKSGSNYRRGSYWSSSSSSNDMYWYKDGKPVSGDGWVSSCSFG